jgi:2,3-dihydroxyphenylpropionate 1,2-dioxygenase
MSRVVLGVGASHSTLMNTHWHEVEGCERARRFRDALDDARDRVRAAEPDVMLIVGPNHFRGLWLDLLPAFTIGVGACQASGESGTPSGEQKVDIALARHLCRGLVRDGFDLAFSTRLQIDHGISHAIQYLLDDRATPIVPLVVNVFAPPLPTLERCADLGRAIGAALAADETDKRVVVVGSGGLSHVLPFPKWYAPETDDDAFFVTAWTEGRSSWRDYDPRRREIIRASTADVREEFDRDFLDRFSRGALRELAVLDEDELERLGGNGAHEIRSWLLMTGACGDAPGSTLVYSPMPEWLTGMAVGVIEEPVAPAPTNPLEDP